MKLLRHRLWKRRPKTLLNVLPQQLIYKRSSVGASRISTQHFNPLPINWKYKHLTSRFLWKAGRSRGGARVLRTRGRVNINRSHLSINYSFRYRTVSIIAGFFFLPYQRKLVSLVYTGAGYVTYLPTTTTHNLFILSRMYKSHPAKLRKYFEGRLHYPLGIVRQGFFLIAQLPKHQPISLVELLPTQGVQYIRSAGCAGIMIKKDWWTHRSLIRLPSGVRKIFSVHSIGSQGRVALPAKKRFRNPKAGYKVNFGFKSIVRGVAMNPVDHPHGGRTKAIKYPRTPWGKTTKFK
jgi:ribosomal protein L2